MNLTVSAVTALAGRLGYASDTGDLIARPFGMQSNITSGTSPRK
jgi:hypothetical protein